MSNCLLIILVIGLCVSFGGFPSRFSKCCFHSFILSCWFEAFSLALAELFLLLTSFIACQAILVCLSSSKSLIISIWFWMDCACSFRYMLANSFCAFFSFRAFVLVGFFLLHLEAVFTFARFSLTANVYHGTLDLVLGFICMYFAAASRWALTKFSYSSFGVSISVFSCSAYTQKDLKNFKNSLIAGSNVNLPKLYSTVLLSSFEEGHHRPEINL